MTGADLLALAAVTVGGGVLRLIRLGDPRALVFDETYYAKDSCWYVEASRALCKTGREQALVHPPLGKWLIGAGIEVFGYDSFGWRVAAAVAGTITIALLYLLARKILSSTVAATLSAGLLAIDFLHFVQSRIAMLDVFVALFGVMAILFLVLDRDRLLAPRPGTPRRAGAAWDRPWRWAAGAAAGAATASKWSGAFFVVTTLVLALAWEWTARRADGRGRPLRRAVRAEGPSILVALVVVPVVVYMLTYVGRLDGSLLALPWSHGSWFRALADRQLYMLDFHRHLTATHPYTSPPWSWLLLKRPVSYYFRTAPNGDYLEIMALGSPLVWWASIAALTYTVRCWFRRRDLAGPEGVVLAGFVLNYAPWLVLAGNRSAVFLFYVLPALPFMLLALGYATARLEQSSLLQPALALFCAGAIGLFVFYYPVLAKVGIPREAWLERIWVFDDCDKPPRAQTAGTKTSGTEQDGDVPPAGWCWI